MDDINELKTAELVTHFDPVLLTCIENPNAKLTLFSFCEGDVFMTSDSYAVTDHIEAGQHVRLELDNVAYTFQLTRPLRKGICNAAFMRHVRATLEDITGIDAGFIKHEGLKINQETTGMCVLKMIGEPQAIPESSS